MDDRNRRFLLIGIVVVAVLCLLGVLAYNIFFTIGREDVAVGELPTATPAATEEAQIDTGPSDAEEDLTTATPTRVIEEEATEEAALALTAEPTEEPTTAPTDTPTPRATATPTRVTSAPAGDSQVPVTPIQVTQEITQVEEILKNGSFELGFDEQGIGLEWTGFETANAVVTFSPETAIPFVLNGEQAQRISIDKATAPNQYGGIFQTVEVIPGEVYTLTINGQIRSSFGDVNASSYGYRVQYATDFDGGVDWQAIPAEEWVELPWEEQGFEESEFTFSTFTTQVTPSSGNMTLFIRGWNKWPDQSLGEYTLDSLSIVGPKQSTILIARTDTGPTTTAGATPATTEEEIIDQPLPVTGARTINLVEDGRFWGGIVVLTLLVLGAVFRAKWRW